MAKSANAVITKVRAMYGRMLSPAQYDELLRRQSVQEISAYLRDKTTYASALGGVQDSTVHRGQLENLLRKDAFYQYVRLVKYVREKDSVYRYVIMDMEIELILSCLRDIISHREDDFIAGIPTFIQPFASVDMFSLANATTVAQMAELLRGTPYGAVFEACIAKYPQEDGGINYTAYEIALRTDYFNKLTANARRDSHGKTLEETLRLINLRAELMNINTIFRLKTYFNAPPAQIRASILPFRCDLSRRALDALVDARDAQTFRQLLSKTSYGRKLDPDAPFIESQTDSIRFRLDLKLLRFSTDPQVIFMSFMLLRNMEMENIIRIIEGVRYQLSPDRIEKLLIRA